MNFSKSFLCGAMFVALIAVSSASAVCTNADLIGTWGFELTSRSGQPGVTVGQVTFDGNGNLTGSDTQSANGTIQTFTFAGTYTLAKNCTGTINTGETFSIVLHNGKRSLEIINSTNGKLEWGFAQAQGTVTCGLSGKKETFAANLFGINNVPDRVATGGQVTLDGNGNLSGSFTQSEEGTISAYSVTGTYTENADCTGTVTVTLPNALQAHFNSVRVNSGKELLVIAIDPGQSFNGTLQK